MKLLNFLRKLKKNFSRYQPSIEILIDSQNIIHNLRQYQKACPGMKIAPVLKSNAYGHGLLQVAKIIQQEDIAFMVVDSLYEAKILRRHGIKSPILIIGYVNAQNILHTRLKNLTFALTSLDQIKQLAPILKKKTVFHLKVDTGMRRQGLTPDEIDEALDLIAKNPHLKITGIYSHFADADGPDAQATKAQIQTWNQAEAKVKKVIPDLQYSHLAATAGSHYAPEINGNMVRLGVGLYGINPSPFQKLDLRPALEMFSYITSVRKLAKGESIGYNFIYQAPRDLQVATVPLGYFEGLDRRLSNNGSFLIEGRECPILGRVSMNITSIDVTSCAKLALEQRVNIISQNPTAPNSLANIAKKIETIPYEVMVKIPDHLRRTVV